MGLLTAILLTSDDNPGMVIVGIADEVVGAIPAEMAPAWHAFATRLAAEGLVAAVDAAVRDRGRRDHVGLYADPAADYQTPGEAAAARVDRVPVPASARLHARATGRCRDCGGADRDRRAAGRPPCAARRAGAVSAPTAPACSSKPRPGRTSRPPTDWSVIDLETTGLWPSVDRIVEIGVVRLAPDGHEVGSWTTLVDPDRDVGATEIHGLTAYDLRGAPRFRDLAPSLLAMLAGTRLAAHNARFDTDFLSCELARAGIDWGTPDALCTMNAISRLGLTSSRQLAYACAELGIPHPDAHCAITDARAASGLLALVLGRLDGDTAVVPWLMDAPLPPPSRLRTDPPPPRLDTCLGAIADRVGVPDGLDYLRRVRLGLPRPARPGARRPQDHRPRGLGPGLGRGRVGHRLRSPCARLHAAYLGGVWDLARADGVITDAETRDLAILGRAARRLARRAGPGRRRAGRPRRGLPRSVGLLHGRERRRASGGCISIAPTRSGSPPRLA